MCTHSVERLIMLPQISLQSILKIAFVVYMYVLRKQLPQVTEAYLKDLH